MARVNLTVHSIDDRNKLSAAIAAASLVTAIDATDGADFVMDERDDKYLILIQNAADAEKIVTIKHGNGIQGVCDLSESVSASSYAFMQLDSGRFKNVTGADKGKVVITGTDANIKVAIFKLP